MARSARLTELARSVEAAFDPPPGPWVVALSGGADSAVCGWVAARRRPGTRALHVHHGLEASDVMAEAASAVATRLEMPFEIIEVRVPPGSSPEGRARTVRYDALLGGLTDGEWLLTGHTADDQAETVLLNLLRGSGSDGLAGIPPRRPPVARPLLGVWRSSLLELATLAGLPWRHDPANQEVRHLRNRLRRRLLPLIEGEYASGVRASLVNTARVLRSEADALDRLASSVGRHRSANGVRISAAELLAVEPAVAARVVRQAFVSLRPPHPPDSERVGLILEVAAGAIRATELPGGGRARRVGPWLELSVGSEAESPPASAVIPVPGSRRWGRYVVDCVVERERPAVPLSPWAIVIPFRGDEAPRLVVRAARRSDAVVAGGGTKGVFAALAEARVPREERAGHPVVEMDGRVVWIPGVRRAGWAGAEADRYLVAVAVEESLWAPSEP